MHRGIEFRTMSGYNIHKNRLTVNVRICKLPHANITECCHNVALLSDQNRYRIDSTQTLCYACGLRNFKELAFQFRRDIPNKELPDKVTSRSDCYWGRNCRTARNKPHHALYVYQNDLHFTGLLQ